MQTLDIDTLIYWKKALIFQPSQAKLQVSQTGLSIAFFDSRIEVNSDLEKSISQPSIGVRLSRSLDGIIQITEVLKHLHTIHRIYIVGQAEEDCYWLGNSCIRAPMLSQYRKLLGAWPLCSHREKIPIWLYTTPSVNQSIDPRLANQFRQLTQCPVIALKWEGQASI